MRQLHVMSCTRPHTPPPQGGVSLHTQSQLPPSPGRLRWPRWCWSMRGSPWTSPLAVLMPCRKARAAKGAVPRPPPALRILSPCQLCRPDLGRPLPNEHPRAAHESVRVESRRAAPPHHRSSPLCPHQACSSGTTPSFSTSSCITLGAGCRSGAARLAVRRPRMGRCARAPTGVTGVTCVRSRGGRTGCAIVRWLPDHSQTRRRVEG